MTSGSAGAHAGPYAGTWRLMRMIARNDRWRLTVWVAGFAALIVLSGASLLATYPDQESIDGYAALLRDNPAMSVFSGPGYGMDDPTIGLILVNEVAVVGSLTIALMSVFMVNRHTRAEEDAQRSDLVRSAVVGPRAPAAAAVAAVTVSQLVATLVTGAGLVALGYSPGGSIAQSLSYLATGLVFSGVTVVAAQIAGTGRATLGVASAVLGSAFVVRGIGDVADSGIRWLSPLAWPLELRAFAGERWWVLGLSAVTGVAAAAVGLRLSEQRDLGAGRFTPGPGRPHARPVLRHPVGFVLHQHRWMLTSWAVGLFVLGAMYASVGDDIEQMVADNPMYSEFLTQAGTGSPTDSYLATVVVIQSLLVCGYLIAAVLHPHTEEASGRAEMVLATFLSRGRWLGSYLVAAGAGALALTFASGVGAGVIFGAVTGDAGQVPRLVGASVAALPAVAVVGAVAVFLFGVRPRAVNVAWGLLVLATVVGLLAEVLDLPAWVRDLSPFTHQSAVPAESVNWAPVVTLLLLAAALVGLGIRGFTNRDLQSR